VDAQAALANVVGAGVSVVGAGAGDGVVAAREIAAGSGRAGVLGTRIPVVADRRERLPRMYCDVLFGGVNHKALGATPAPAGRLSVRKHFDAS